MNNRSAADHKVIQLVAKAHRICRGVAMSQRRWIQCMRVRQAGLRTPSKSDSEVAINLDSFVILTVSKAGVRLDACTLRGSSWWCVSLGRWTLHCKLSLLCHSTLQMVIIFAHRQVFDSVHAHSSGCTTPVQLARLWVCSRPRFRATRKHLQRFHGNYLKANARCFPISRSHLFSLTLTLSLSHPLSHTLSISLTLSHSLSLSLFHSLTHSLSHSLILSLSHSLSKCPPHGCHVHASSLDGHRRGRLVCGGARVPRA